MLIRAAKIKLKLKQNRISISNINIDIFTSISTYSSHHNIINYTPPSSTSIMSANVGLPTPRGSGTSGYVQRNLSYLRPRDPRPTNYPGPEEGFRQRQPDKQILEHDRRRAIEVKCLEERDRLEEENEKAVEEGKKEMYTEEEIDERIEELRKKLTRELEEEGKGAGAQQQQQQRQGRGQFGRRGWGQGEPAAPAQRKNFKAYQVHEQAEAKIEESERFRRAVQIPDSADAAAAGGRDAWRDRDSHKDRWRGLHASADDRDRDDDYDSSRRGDRDRSYRSDRYRPSRGRGQRSSSESRSRSPSRSPSRSRSRSRSRDRNYRRSHRHDRREREHRRRRRSPSSSRSRSRSPPRSRSRSAAPYRDLDKPPSPSP